MQEDNLVEYRNPGIALPVADALTEVLRRGASTLLQQAVEAEVAEYVAQYLELKDELGRQRVVPTVICRSAAYKRGSVKWR